MNPGELCKVRSRLHLPDHVIKFIQKRYSSLLLAGENNAAKSVAVVDDNNEIMPKPKEESEYYDEQHQQSQEASIDMVETTELTVIKDVFVDDSKQQQQLQEQQQQAESESITAESSPSPTQLKDVVKVEEETLYIVEKRRRVQSSSTQPAALPMQQQPDEITTTTVESEIRKNFELKPKEKENEPMSPRGVIQNTMNNLSPAPVSVTPPPVTTITTTSTKLIEATQAPKKSASAKNIVRKMIEDLRLSIDEFNRYFQQQQQLNQLQQIQTEINDYQLHFFKVNFIELIIEQNFINVIN